MAFHFNKKAICIIPLLLLSFSLCALKLDRVILSTDTNPLYYQFWPLAARLWRDIVGIKPTLAVIGNKTDLNIDEEIGEVLYFEPLPDVPTGLYAQCIRLLVPAYFENETCLVADIDMIPLQKDYFTSSIKSIPDDHFVVYRDDYHPPQYKLYPMCYVAGKGKLFKEIFGITSLEEIPRIITKWKNRHLGLTTDELILYEKVNRWATETGHCTKLGHSVNRRIDRSNWDYNTIALQQLYYIDAHLPRPYNNYQKIIDQLASYTEKANK